MSKFNIEVGQEFGKLKVKGIVNNFSLKIETRSKCWLCKCTCGGQIILTSTDLRDLPVNKMNCGCIGVNFTGKKIDHLKVVCQTISTSKFKSRGVLTITYLCQCDCGELMNIEMPKLIYKKILQCKKCGRISVNKK